MFKKISVTLIVVHVLFISAISHAKLPRGVEKITSIEGITEYRLKNGLQVLLFPDVTQETITVNVTYKVGSKHENYGETGMAHLLEHLVFKGTPRHPNIPKELTDHGAEPNGTTWTDRTNYFETFSATDENLNWALDLEADRMVNSFIRKEDLDSEMTVVRNELENGENSPVRVLISRMLAASYDWHNYGKSTIGAISDLENVKIENLKAFYKKYYQPDNATLIVTGKIDEDKTIKLVNKYFSKIKKPKRSLQALYTEEPIQDGERQVTIRRSGDVKVVASMYKIPAGFDSAFPAVTVLTNILGDPTSGRLQKSLVKNKLAAFAYGFNFQWGEPSVMTFLAQLGGEEDIEPTKKKLIETLENVFATPITAAEVSRAKSKLLKQYKLSFNSSQTIALELSEWIGMGDWRLMFLDRDGLEKVSLESVQAAADEYLVNDNRTLGLFIPEENPNRADSIVRLKQEDVALLVENYKGRENIDIGESFDPSHENIDQRSVLTRLESGSLINFLNKKTRGKSVVATMNFDIGNESALQNKSVVGSLAMSMISRGSKNYSREELQEEFDRLEASVSIGGGATGIGVSLNTTRENLADVLDVIDHVIKNPTFDSSELDMLKDELIVSLEQEKQQPTSVIFKELRSHLNPYSKGHPYASMTIDEEIELIRQTNVSELREFYYTFMHANSFNGAVVGDFDEQIIETKLNKLTGGWETKVPYQRIQTRVANKEPINKLIDTPDKAGAAFGALHTFALRDDNPDYPALMMANQMFGGGFISSRLANRLRQQDGLSYGARSFLTVGSFDENATFGAYAICAPENLDRVEIGFKEELNRVLQDGFTQQELDDARKGVLENAKLDRAKDGRLVRTLSNNIDLERTMMWDKNYEDALKSLTVAQVNVAFRKYFPLENFSIVKAGDSSKL